jgi:hypothetical protein
VLFVRRNIHERLCDKLITRPEESYRLWCDVVCDLENPQELGGYDPRWVAAPQKKHTRKNKHELVTTDVTVCMSPHLINRITYSILTDGYMLANNSLQHQTYLTLSNPIFLLTAYSPALIFFGWGGAKEVGGLFVIILQF